MHTHQCLLHNYINCFGPKYPVIIMEKNEKQKIYIYIKTTKQITIEPNNEQRTIHLSMPWLVSYTPWLQLYRPPWLRPSLSAMVAYTASVPRQHCPVAAAIPPQCHADNNTVAAAITIVSVPGDPYPQVATHRSFPLPLLPVTVWAKISQT